MMQSEVIPFPVPEKGDHDLMLFLLQEVTDLRSRSSRIERREARREERRLARIRASIAKEVLTELFGGVDLPSLNDEAHG